MANVRFADVYFAGGEIESTRPAAPPKASAFVQSDPLVCADKEVQSFFRKEMETQTEQHASSGNAEDNIDDAKGDLASFLNRVEPLVTATLVNNLSSRAFDGYVCQWSDARHDILPLHRLHRGGGETSVMPVSAVSWNATGHLLAVSFGCMDHTSLCTHTGVVWCWNLTRKYIKEGTPDLSIESAACGMCLAFHPSDPTLLACGTFNGGVIVWRVCVGEETKTMENVLTPHSHREAVNDVSWIADPIDRNHKLLSVAGDGKLMLWTVANKLAAPLAVMDLAQEGGRAALTRGFNLRGKTAGGTSLHVSTTDPGSFIVTSEGGGVFRGLVNLNEISANSRRKDAGVSTTAIKISFAYEPHAGPVASCQTSPFCRHVFATCGLDSQIRLYNSLVPLPLHTLSPSPHPLSCVVWSPTRPMVVAASDEGGGVYVYDLKQSTLSWQHRLVVAVGEEVPSPA